MFLSSLFSRQGIVNVSYEDSWRRRAPSPMQRDLGRLLRASAYWDVCSTIASATGGCEDASAVQPSVGAEIALDRRPVSYPGDAPVLFCGPPQGVVHAYLACRVEAVRAFESFGLRCFRLSATEENLFATSSWSRTQRRSLSAGHFPGDLIS